MRQKRIKPNSPPCSHSRPNFILAEMLECRRMLSAIPDPQAYPTDGAVPQFQAGSNSPTGFSPAQIRSAYGIDNIKFNGVTGDGSGQTIAIIVAHDNPMFVDTGDPNFNTSDLHLFDQQFGLPDPPSFMKVDSNGGTDYPDTDTGWANEIALDVEWTHAIAPAANILLVEASSTNLSNLIEGAVQYATSVPGVSTVTMSFAVSEFMNEDSYDSFLQSPTGHGITFLAASGDNGNQGGYPAYSPDVVSVGATSLTLSGNNYGSETGRNTSGGGISSDESKPDYQFGVNESSSQRTSPDVSFDGDPNTGVSVYDSFNGGSSPWYKIGGTSFSSPAWAALIAIADQGRVLQGLGTLDGPTQTLPRLYSLNSSDFHDITSGNNGFSARPGYDLVTGLGTPIADKLIPDLVGGNSVSGVAFTDSNGNGVQDNGELPLHGVSVFTDIYNNGIFEGADQQISTASDGTYTLSDIPGGTYKIAAVIPSGYKRTTAANYSVTGTLGSSTAGKNFGFEASNTPAEVKFAQVPSTATAGTALVPAITVDVDDNTGNLVISDNSAVTLSLATGTATLGGTFTVNAVNGVATFSNITITPSGAVTLTATDGSLTPDTSSSITVQGDPTAPAGSVLSFGQAPTDTTVGAVISPAITVLVSDSTGALLTSDGSTVTLAIASGNGNLGGTLSVNAVNGVATFGDLTIDTADNFTLVATDGQAAPVTSPTFAVKAIPAQLAFAQQPFSTNAGAVLVPIIVQVQDGGGNTVLTDNSPVTLAIATGSGTLGGTLTVNAVNGLATFNNITFSVPDTYSLTATDGSLTSATSDNVIISVPGSLTPAIVRNTLAGSLVAGSKVHATLVVSESNAAVNVRPGTVTTNVFATLDGTQTLLGTISRNMSLKAKKGLTVSVPISLIPAGLNGNYTLQCQVVDSAGNTQLINSSAVTISPPIVALSETVTKLTLPIAVIAGGKTNAVAVVKITNNGNIPSTGLTTTRIYASPDGTINAGELLNSVSRSSTIKPGKSVTVTVPLQQFPATLSGKLHILAEVTDPNAVRTFIDSGTQVTAAAPFVALAGTFGALTSTSVAAGKTVNVTITLQNNGNIDSAGLASINLGLTADKTTEVPGSVAKTQSVKIPAGKSTVLHLKVVVPAGLTPGQYFPYLVFSQGTASFTAVGPTAVTVS